MSNNFPEKYFSPTLPNSNEPNLDYFGKGFREFGTASINLVKNVRISENSVVFNYFKIFEDSCITPDDYKRYSKGYKFYFKFLLPKLNFSKKRFLLITDEWTSNYYHWHMFALQRLVALKKNNFLQDSVLVLPEKYKKYPFVLPSLQKFGISEKEIVFLPKKRNIKTVETAIVKVSDYSLLIKEVREILLKNTTEKDFGFGEKIYISRAKQNLRSIVNEKETLLLLEQYGFKKVVMEDFSYDEQINIMRKAKYVISPHGAGLLNILFMPQDGAILELRTKPNSDRPATGYCRMAFVLGLKYFSQICDHVGHDIHSTHKTNLSVNLKKLEKNLELFLN